jgi:hypothetical protein
MRLHPPRLSFWDKTTAQIEAHLDLLIDKDDIPDVYFGELFLKISTVTDSFH